MLAASGADPPGMRPIAHLAFIDSLLGIQPVSGTEIGAPDATDDKSSSLRRHKTIQASLTALRGTWIMAQMAGLGRGRLAQVPPRVRRLSPKPDVTKG